MFRIGRIGWRARIRTVVSVCFLGGAVLLNAAPVGAQTGQVSQTELEDLKALIELQTQQIETQRGLIQAQQQRLDALEATTSNLETITLSLYDSVSQPAYYQPAVADGARYGAGSEGYAGGFQPALYRVAPELGRLTAQDRGYAQAQAAQAQAPVGEATPQEQQPPEVTLLAERGGVLTSAGTLVVEPSIEFSKTSSNRLNFRGISIVEGVLVGIIEAFDADRDTVTAALTLRYGVTDRFEVEVKVPYRYRNDRTSFRVEKLDEDLPVRDLADHGIGDVEVAAHYQINRGRDGWPFFIANLRFKSTTGTGPFDVSRDEDGAPTELPMGSGFYGVEPSITVLFPTDPAVLFANVGYLMNIEDDVNASVGGSVLGTVDPGDSLGISFGVGFSLNEELSLSLGYQHDFVGGTTTELTDDTGTRTVESNTLSVGSFLFGVSYRLNDWLGFNLTTQIGATTDAPDVSLLLRVPIALDLF